MVCSSVLSLEALEGRCMPTFSVSNHVVPLNAGEVAAADFNEDGNTDMAVPQIGAASVALLLGNGDGTFSAGGSFGNSGTMRSEAGDFNGDGHMDVAMLQPEGLLVFVGDGTGTLQFADDVKVPQSWYVGVEVGDFNGDGRDDIAIGAREQVELYFMNCCDDILQAGDVYPFGGFYPQVESADFDDDGNLDLAVSGNDRSKGYGLYILKGRGNGSFVLMPQTYLYGRRTVDLVAADFNHDSRIDLVVSSAPNYEAIVLLGAGDATFSPWSTLKTNHYDLEAADYNEDGHVDLATTHEVFQVVVVVIGQGDGTFEGFEPYKVGGFPFFITNADFNNDGLTDLACPHITSPWVSVLMNIPGPMPLVPPRRDSHTLGEAIDRRAELKEKPDRHFVERERDEPTSTSLIEPRLRRPPGYRLPAVAATCLEHVIASPFLSSSLLAPFFSVSRNLSQNGACMNA